MENYYKVYETADKNNTELGDLLEDRDNMFRDRLREKFDGKPLRALILGSATTRNISSAQDFLVDQIRVSADESKIFLLDRAPGSLDRHKAYADKDPRIPRVYVVGGDVTSHPFGAEDFDLILSDYTTSFLGSEASWQNFFQEIKHSLAGDGRAIVQCLVCRDENIPSILRLETAYGDRFCLSGSALQAAVQNAGLEIEAQDYRAASRVYEGHASEVATLVLKRRGRAVSMER